MFSDHDNPTAAAAAPAQHSESSGSSSEIPKTVEPGTIETQIHVTGSAKEATPAPVAQA